MYSNSILFSPTSYCRYGALTSVFPGNVPPRSAPVWWSGVSSFVITGRGWCRQSPPTGVRSPSTFRPALSPSKSSWSKKSIYASFYCEGVLQFTLHFSMKNVLTTQAQVVELPDLQMNCTLFITRKAAHLHETLRIFNTNSICSLSKMLSLVHLARVFRISRY